MAWRWSLIAVLLAVGVPSCSPSVCTDIAIPGLNVTVTDSVTGQRICDAVVTAVRGTKSENLMAFPAQPASNCVYAGAYEEAGDYDINVTHTGYAPATIGGVVVSSDGCHVGTQVRSVALTPM